MDEGDDKQEESPPGDELSIQEENYNALKNKDFKRGFLYSPRRR